MRNMNDTGIKAWRARSCTFRPAGDQYIPGPAPGVQATDQEKEGAVMVFSEQIVACLVLVLLIGHAGHTSAQAPGDGHAICTDEILEGTTNPFFANRPVYSASERPLMDSRDYNHLLQGSSVYIPWQSVDRDNNNTIQDVTRVCKVGVLPLAVHSQRLIKSNDYLSPVDSTCISDMCSDSDSVWIQCWTSRELAHHTAHQHSATRRRETEESDCSV